MLILSSVLILALALVGDFGDLIDEVGNNESTIDLGSMQNCDPGSAICSVARVIEGNRTKLALGFNDRVKVDTSFSINLKVTGINKQKIRRVEIHFSQPDKEMEPIIERFKYTSSRGDALSSWKADAKIPLLKDVNTQWQARIEISTLEQNYTGSFFFSVIE